MERGYGHGYDDESRDMPMCFALWVEFSDEHNELIKQMRMLVNDLRNRGADIKAFSISDIDSSEKLLRMASQSAHQNDSY